MTDRPPPLWVPAADARVATRLGQFMDMAAERSGRRFDDYYELWQWSVEDLDGFWAAIWDFFEVRASVPYTKVLSGREMPGARWFEGARLNYAEHALSFRGFQPAVVGRSQTVGPIEWSRDDLRDQVARVRAGLVRLGVRRGDRVAAYLPNVPEAIAAFLATASLGAVWTSCAPEFGVQAVLDRFSQVEPTVLLAVDGYRYGDREIRRDTELAEIRSALPTLRATVVLPYPHESTADDVVHWTDFTSETAPLIFEQVPADHPLYVLYSSGTTGMPKAIVHAHGGLLVEHLKALGLHADMGPDDTFFWFTTTGWMMWNYLVGGLLVGATVVTFDGDPGADGPATLWRLAGDADVTWFGVGAPLLAAARRADLHPGEDFTVPRLRAIGSTGAPLPAPVYRWVYDVFDDDVMLSSISGGTDLCTAFVGGGPLTPVWEGEISCRYLGAAVAAFDDDDRSVVEQQGELVLTAPMPSMPVGFWGDDDSSRYRAAYFDDPPGVWRHGDWITITTRGSCIISGRSDATLNRGGVRVGTAEFYRALDELDEVTDSLVVHLEDRSGEGPGELVLLVALAPSARLDNDLTTTIRSQLRAELSPRHVPDEIHQVDHIPTTLSGKKLELPVKRILLGAEPATVASPGSLREPRSLQAIADVAAQRRRSES
jgi:acetoacetyl-CoA synthetase